MTAHVLIWSRKVGAIVCAVVVTIAPALAQQAGKQTAEKPALSTPSSGVSAAERIKRRLDETFPIHTGKPQSGSKAPQTSARPASPRANERVILTWRISLVWPEEITPTASR